MAKFEWLANELLLELFEYLNTIHLFRSFYDLNTRFNNLLTMHFRMYHLDLRCVSKRECNTMCQRYLPLIIDRVFSLYLSNDNETPNLLELFLSHHLTLNEFYHLHLLSLDSLPVVNRIIIECQHLPYFTHLYITKCIFTNQEDFFQLIKNIWSLPKLILCQITHRFPQRLTFPNGTMLSTSIKTLFIENINFNLNDLSNLFRCTPFLQQFNATITYHSECQQLYTVRSSIISLKLDVRNALHSMMNLFENLPNLSRLILKTKGLYLNGYEWKKIILNYFPKIRIFRLRMDLKFSYSKNIEKQLDELLNSFETSFWLEEHQWFVRCDWFLFGMSHFAMVYTLPYSFEEFILANKRWSKSTLSNKNDYDRVNILTLMNIKSNSFRDCSLFNHDFRNIFYLKINLPFDYSFWSSSLSLDRLISLDVMLLEGADYLPLQMLLDRSPRLYSLCFGNFSDLEIVSQLKSRSIQKLDFMKKNTYKKYFNSKQCCVLINSSFGRQCKVLLIDVENRIDVVQLVNNMFDLRSLIFQCKDDKWNDRKISLNDELIQWLWDHLPSTCSVIRDMHQTSNIRLWIS